MLVALIGLLQKVVSKESINKMGPPNLAIVFAPSIVREQTETPQSALMSMRVYVLSLLLLLIATSLTKRSLSVVQSWWNT
jgi:hypothetical protein